MRCAARRVDADADQAPPAAGGAQQPAGTHSSSANGPGYGRAQRQGQHSVYSIAGVGLCMPAFVCFPTMQPNPVFVRAPIRGV